LESLRSLTAPLESCPALAPSGYLRNTASLLSGIEQTKTDWGHTQTAKCISVGPPSRRASGNQPVTGTGAPAPVFRRGKLCARYPKPFIRRLLRSKSVSASLTPTLWASGRTQPDTARLCKRFRSSAFYADAKLAGGARLVQQGRSGGCPLGGNGGLSRSARGTNLILTLFSA